MVLRSGPEVYVVVEDQATGLSIAKGVLDSEKRAKTLPPSIMSWNTKTSAILPSNETWKISLRDAKTPEIRPGLSANERQGAELLVGVLLRSVGGEIVITDDELRYALPQRIERIELNDRSATIFRIVGD